VISELARGDSPERVASATGAICFDFRDSDFGIPQASLFPRSLLERRSPGADFKRLEPFRILLVEFLVVRLGWIKLHRRQNFRHDRLGEFARVRQLFL
jgi:hypothetical protein